MAIRSAQEEHDRMVAALAQGLVKEGYQDVRADVEAFDPPNELVWEDEEEGFVPDITGEKERLVIIEVETADSIHDAHTEAEWAMFAAAALIKGGVFIVAVPRRAVDDARARLRALQIEATVWGLRSPDAGREA